MASLFAQDTPPVDPMENNNTEQEENLSDDHFINDKIEMIANSIETDMDYSTLLETLMYFKKHPLNLNSASKEDLMDLQVMNDLQVENLLEHIRKYGKLITIYELQAVDGFDLESIFILLPFVKVSGQINDLHISLKEMMHRGKHSIFLRAGRVLEQQKGYTPNDDKSLKNPNLRYLGDPYKMYTRYKFSYGTKVSWGFTAEKDPGEEFFKGSNKPSQIYLPYQGFDYYTAHIFIRDIGIVKSLAIGDFTTQFGQGLVLWSGLAYGKTADVVNVKKFGQGLRPYGSVNENLFMRGLGTTLGYKKFRLTLFGSKNRIDANALTKDTVSQEVATITSLQTSGYHRTQAEVADKNVIDESNFGGNLSYKYKNLTLGITAAKSYYSANYVSNPTIYNQFDSKGRELSNVGIDYAYAIRNFNFFGEFAKSLDGGIAYVNGVLLSLDPRVTFSMVHRHYARDYFSRYSRGFAETPGTNNEDGLYMGIYLKLNKMWTLSGFYDNFSFPWLQTGVNAPSRGSDFLGQVTFAPNKTTSLYFRYREKNKQTNSSNMALSLDQLIDQEKRNYRFHASYPISPAFSMDSRFEVADYKKDFDQSYYGYLIFQDVSYKGLNSPITFSFRYALFDIQNSKANIYAYETDVLYSYSIPSFTDRGSRVYLTTKYNIFRGLDIWLRYAVSLYDHKTVISPGGLEEIQGSTKSDFKVQLRYEF